MPGASTQLWLSMVHLKFLYYTAKIMDIWAGVGADVLKLAMLTRSLVGALSTAQQHFQARTTVQPRAAQWLH